MKGNGVRAELPRLGLAYRIEVPGESALFGHNLHNASVGAIISFWVGARVQRVILFAGYSNGTFCFMTEDRRISGKFSSVLVTRVRPLRARQASKSVGLLAAFAATLLDPLRYSSGTALAGFCGVTDSNGCRLPFLLTSGTYPSRSRHALSLYRFVSTRRVASRITIYIL